MKNVVKNVLRKIILATIGISLMVIVIHIINLLITNQNSNSFVLQSKQDDRDEQISNLKQELELLKNQKSIDESIAENSAIKPQEENSPNLKIAPFVKSTPKTPENSPVATPSPSILVSKDINLQSIVSVYCNFIDYYGNEKPMRGSGVIVNSAKGYILTNRHVIDLNYSNWLQGVDDNIYYLKNGSCKIYFLADKNILSSVPQNKYPFYDINAGPNNYDFLAKPILVPSPKNGFSASEIEKFDFALLQFTNWNVPKYSFGRTTVPLHQSPIFSGKISINTRVIFPGFAFQQEGVTSFDTSRLTIGDGEIVGFSMGDKVFKDVNLKLDVKYNPDAFGGRSGSPIFWNGYVVGLVCCGWIPNEVTGKLVSRQVDINAVISFLKKNGFMDAISELKY